jgi:hypothetical protein
MNSTRVHDVAEGVCKTLEQAQNNEDQVAALELLRSEVKKDTSAMDSEEAKEYMAQLTQELQESKQLPVLSLAYADQFAADVSRTDLRDELRSVNRSLRFGENDKQLDKAMLRFLLDNYDDGAVLIESVDEESDYDSTISRADIDAKLAQFRSSAKSK